MCDSILTFGIFLIGSGTGALVVLALSQMGLL